MATEIERKFLVKDDGWREHAGVGRSMRQGYLTTDNRSSVRVRLASDEAWINIKSATLGIWRQEFDYAIPPEDAREILDNLCEGALIEKTRYEVPVGRHVWEVDVFEGANAGLVVAEVELSSTEEPFLRPPWAGEEVSDDPRYYNVCLVRHPYRDW